MSEQFDVVVVGAGLAGLAAATRVAEKGLVVCVLEQSADEAYLCNSRYTGGLFHIAMDDLMGDPDWVKANLNRAVSGEASPELIDALVHGAPRAVTWLKSKGIRFISAGADGLRRNALAPPGVRQTGLNWRGRAGDVMLRTLGDQLARYGGVLNRGVRATELLVDDEGVCVGLLGVRGTETIRFNSKAVVLADGGFQADTDLVRQYISPKPEHLLQRNAESGRGDGLKMAQAIGAQLTGMDRFYGHIQYQEAMHDQRFWPYPVLDSLAVASIVVDGHGRRFCDEGRGGVYVANQIARLNDPLTATIIFDAAIWEGPGRDWLVPANPYLLSAGGHLIKADTLDSLAAAIGVDPQELEGTVAQHNIFAEGGELSGGEPERTVSTYKAWPIIKAPFFAIKVCAGITYTMGGVLIDEHARVLNVSGDPIVGLYAAGSCTGGLEGGGYAGYSGGLSKASTFGLIAGDSIVESLMHV